MLTKSNLLPLFAVWAVLVLTQNRVRNIAVRDNLNRAVVVAQLLLGDYVRIVAVNMAIYADDATNNTRNCANIVRHHHYRHLLRKVV